LKKEKIQRGEEGKEKQEKERHRVIYTLFSRSRGGKKRQGGEKEKKKEAERQRADLTIPSSTIER